jgi:arginyl-tRNA synthetase
MILALHHAVRRAVTDAIGRLYDIADTELAPIQIGYPPNRALGDLSIAIAFELARTLRKAPRAIAQEIAAQVGTIDGVARVDVAGAGYLNFFLDRPRLLAAELRPHTGLDTAAAPAAVGEKAIVEHTAINPNKAAHVGHLRNVALGDTLARLLRFQGVAVEVQNYIDDTGVQVADVVVGFRYLESKGLEEIRRIADRPRFDYYCWDLYARVTEWYEADRARLEIRAATLHDIEHGGNDNAALAAFITDRIVRRHLETTGRLNVDYDLLAWEGDILRLQFWARAFEILKEIGAVFLQTEGKLAGCWVMRIDEAAAEPPPEAADSDEDAEESREKVIVRSNGTVTYVGKDIAYQFWKFGLLGKDFNYREFARRSDGGVLWATSTEPVPVPVAPPAFGRADAAFNVIDTRQEYLQKLLKQALATMGYTREAERSVHFSYAMVGLSHATARELGYESFDPSKPFVEVSGRKGLGVKADDLLDRLTEKAGAEVAVRNPDLADRDRERTARAIATAALRYFMIKFSRTKIIAFDIEEALSFEGESGPYLQYAAVRAGNIFQKLEDRLNVTESDIVAGLSSIDPGLLTASGEGDELWALVLEAARLDEVVNQAVRTLELSVLAKYAFTLAQMFNAFYHKYPILNEERADARAWRAAAASYFRLQITRALDLMGCEVPSRM